MTDPLEVGGYAVFKTIVVSALAAVLLVAATGCALLGPSRLGVEQEATLIAVLESDAELKDKADACRELARVGTGKCVPTLAALLGDEKLSHSARYALEPIPCRAVDKALRAALSQVKGRPLVGVIGSIGVRRDAKATGDLTALLCSTDPDVAPAAARALGSIGTPAAVEALENALADAPAGNEVALCEGLFRCAEALAASDRGDQAMGIYDRLRGLQQAPHQVCAGALRGAILTRGSAGLPLLLEAIRGEDYALVAAAAHTALELPGPAVTEALATELGTLPAEKQILLTQTLGKRADAAALPALLALAKGGGDTAARVAAVQALPEIGLASATPVLLALQNDGEDDVAKAAREALAALAGSEVDAVLVSMLSDKDAATRVAAVELLGQRRVVGAVPDLLKTAEDADESVRAASIGVLGELAGAAEFTQLVDLLLKATSAAEIQAAERSLSALCVREAQAVPGKVVIRKAVYGDLPDGASADVTTKFSEIVKAGSLLVEATNGNFGDPARGIVKTLRVEYTVDGKTAVQTVKENQTIALTSGVTPQAFVEALCDALEKAAGKPELDIALLRVLHSAGGPEALAALRAGTTADDAAVKAAAVSLLCSWPTAEALPDVIGLAKSGTDPRTKVLALRGCFRLIPLQDGSDAEKLASLQRALALAERTEEKRLALAALAGIPTPAALAVATAYLSDPALKEEASLAAVGIAETIVKSHRSEVNDAMVQVLKVTGNKKTTERAKALAGRAGKAAPTK